MYDLANFSLKDMTECGRILRQMGDGAKNMEEAANKITRYLYEYLIDAKTGKNNCVLVRLFKTHPYRNLDKNLQEFAQKLLENTPAQPEMQNLVLVATVGELPEWNSRLKSTGHKAIPLRNEKAVSAIPMISNLIRQLGLKVTDLIKPRRDILLDLSSTKYNVFYVPDAKGNPIIPAQDDFVIPFGVKTVLGFGGILSAGSLFSVIIFTNVSLKREVADLFKTLALDIKLALLPFEDKVFT